MCKIDFCHFKHDFSLKKIKLYMICNITDYMPIILAITYLFHQE